MPTTDRKRYSRLVLTIPERPTQRQDPSITFTDEDYEGTIPYSDNPMGGTSPSGSRQLGQRTIFGWPSKSWAFHNQSWRSVWEHRSILLVSKLRFEV
ncbi:hypothetical protein CR513_59788, partial [Mucuna pruriens]